MEDVSQVSGAHTMGSHCRAVEGLLCAFFVLVALAPADGRAALPAAAPQSGSFAVTARVDRRVELMSIVARLAGYPEYVNNSVQSYAADVDAYFANYKQHPAIRFAIQIRMGTREIGPGGIQFD